MLLKSNLPSIDLHGETTDVARVLVNDFIDDNYKMGNEEVVIIHGKGTGALKKTVHETLKKNKKVKEFKLDYSNVGSTIIIIDKK